MTSPLNWQDFLKQAELPKDSRCLQISTPLYTLIKVSGSDAESFLHAQLSNSVTGLQSDEVRFAAWCNAKGRVWTLLRYWKDGDSIILRLPSDQLDDTMKRLRMFVLRSDVQLTPLDWQATQFVGPEAETQANQLSNSLSDQTYNIALPGAWPIYEVWSTSTHKIVLPELPEVLIALPRILAGIPEIFAEQREEWIPQMLNLDIQEGIDFKKGCYPGQEVVAKLHYKGGLKQRIICAALSDTSATPQTNQNLLDSAGNKVATIIEVANTATTYWILAVARIETMDKPMFFDGHALNLLKDE